MIAHTEESTVVIIGGGASGLTLATFLKKSGVACVVLERQGRAYIAQRQRAGVVEARGVRMFERWGLADQLLGGPIANTVEYRVNGVGRVFEVVTEAGSASRFCTQQMLVNNLLVELIDRMGGDVRFDVHDIQIENEEGRKPRVSYIDAIGSHEIVCNYIAGCDAAHGVSRVSIPDGVVTTYTHEYGYAWLAALVEAPAKEHAIMAISDHGFAAQIPRGPQRSRYYLQCALSDSEADWSDERLWNEIRLRLGDPRIENVAIHDKLFVPLRSVVHVPMQYRNLFLAGDAAHLVPPTGAKGMNLALFDVDVLAQAILRAAHTEDRTGLENYSGTCLQHVWRYQEFSQWITDTMHDAGNPSLRGAFQQKISRARLDALFASPTAIRLHSEYQQGML
jgi:p-hydroxybenzoate 3-monooxygenase